MRRVWGWTPASSAATEITNTARSSAGPWVGRSAIAHAPLLVHAEVRPRRDVGQRGELAQQVTLLARELLGHGDLHGDQHVAAGLGTAVAGDAAPLDPEGAPVLGPSGDLQGHLAGQGRHGQLGAQRRLGEGHRHRHGQVLAAPAEERVRRDVDLHDQVTGGRGGRAGLPLALQLDAGAVGHPRGDADLQLPGADLGAAPVAGLAGVVDDGAPALAGRARAGEAEEALVAGDRPAAVAGRAMPRQRPRRGAGALAGMARGRPAQLQRDGGPPDGLLEAEGDLALDVAAAARGALLVAPAAEEVPEEAPETSEVAQVTEVLDPDPLVTEAAATRKASEPTEGARPDQPARLVVLGPLLGVGQHAVGPPDLLETLLGGPVAGVGVRVELLGELPIGLLHVLGRGVLGHPQDRVEVLLEILRVVHASTWLPSPWQGA